MCEKTGVSHLLFHSFKKEHIKDYLCCSTRKNYCTRVQYTALQFFFYKFVHKANFSYFDKFINYIFGAKLREILSGRFKVFGADCSCQHSKE